jgi:hypothetical protein
MAAFYVLPPRECLEQSAADFLAATVPGLAPPADLLDRMLESLTDAHPDTYFVHREHLPADDHAGGLRDGFGAGPDDVIVDVGLTVNGRPARVRRWAVSDPPTGR